MPSKDINSTTAPRGPDTFDDEPNEESGKPQPEVMGEKVPWERVEWDSVWKKKSSFHGRFHPT